MWIGGVGWRGYLPFSADCRHNVEPPAPPQCQPPPDRSIHPGWWEIQCSLFIVNNNVNNTRTFSPLIRRICSYLSGGDGKSELKRPCQPIDSFPCKMWENNFVMFTTPHLRGERVKIVVLGGFLALFQRHRGHEMQQIASFSLSELLNCMRGQSHPPTPHNLSRVFLDPKVCIVYQLCTKCW